MNNMLIATALRKDLELYFSEDDLARNIFYTSSLPKDMVQCSLKIKDDMILAGLPYFVEAFRYLGAENLKLEAFEQYEGKKFLKSEKAEIKFELPFSIALTGERIALNLLQQASSIATYTNQFVEIAKEKGVSILDTRKTTPGHRSLEKYAVRIGGGHNHRLGQTDLWMVKDNHKSFFGGVKQAVEFFQSMKGFYTPIEVEVHNMDELDDVLSLGIRHIMLDNFTPEMIEQAVAKKPSGVTFEVSGGIRLSNLNEYLIDGLDAISVGALTYGAPSVDVSLKYHR
ncbi:carboxylating nicotinate-nucleotide diphosphorylase [Halobacteriovorax sp. GB3]|uniref:carboxylating nicotinate-nucleotide diphosphorylase n=1 Tax=Halobacteriovorax sp. GB3 TaxID=2719615 RepID=UPI00235E74D4|nr:carboxylating nicotinate-nucleotide diphosphorylase [Halobacteriovorax sp. GB3]MDD0854409.1 carboxylating nicotinate-nucleotide diphosphorylase [Halobacteriovorax sp. GB3]